MSGHSHWAGIKHKKAIEDAKRANLFTKFGRLVTLAARDGGGNPETNFKLKIAINQARSVNMPKDNIERAIKRGTGELKDSAIIEEITYEALAPGNIALLIKATTDNKNRTLSEVKHLLTKLGGKLVPNGSVSFMFKTSGIILINLEDTVSQDEKEEIELKIIEAGAEDICAKGANKIIIYTKPAELQKVEEALEKEKFNILSAELGFVPTQNNNLAEKDKSKYEKALEALEEHDDVQNIYNNRG